MGIELGIGESLLIKAIAESTGRKTKEVQTELKKEGDLGLVAMVSIRWFHFQSTRMTCLPRIPKTLNASL